MKPCPYCGEQIQAVAVKCRFCGEWLDPNARPSWSTTQGQLPPDLAREVAKHLAGMVGGTPGQEEPAAAPVAAPQAGRPATQPGLPATSTAAFVAPGLPSSAPAPAAAEYAEPAPAFGAPAPRLSAWDPEPQREPEPQPEPEPAPEASAPSAWDPPTWLASGQPAAPTQREVAQPHPAPQADVHDLRAPGAAERAGLAEVAGRMQRLKDAAAVVKRDVEQREAQRAAERAQAEQQRREQERQQMEAEARHFEHQATLERMPPMRHAEPAGIPDDDDDAYDVPVAARTPAAEAERPVAAMPAAARPTVQLGSPAPEDRATVADMPASPEPTRRQVRAPVADDDDDELDDAPSGEAADFESGFLGGMDDDGDDDDDDDDDDLGEVQGGRSRLPMWLGIGVGFIAVVGGLGAAYGLGFIGGNGGDPVAETETATEGEEVKEGAVVDGGDADGKAEEAKAEPVPPPADTDGEAAAEGGETGEAAADGGEAAADEGGEADAGTGAPQPADPEAFAAKIEEARAAYKSGKLKQVIPLAEEALVMAPDHPDALALIANANLEQGKTEEAKAAADKCVKIDPKVADCWLTVAVLAETESDKEAALAGWEKYLELAPEGRYARNAKKAIKRLSK